MGDVDNGDGYARMKEESIWDLSVPSSQFWCEFKTSLKKKKTVLQKNSNLATMEVSSAMLTLLISALVTASSIRTWDILSKNFTLDVLNA